MSSSEATNLSAAEQYLLELINRARLDPEAEADRYGIDLNADLAPGRLDGTAKQPLAPNALLNAASWAHSDWMLDTDSFSHTGEGGSDPGDRMRDAGYVFSGSWTWGENIAWSGTPETIDLDSAIDTHHRGLFLSAGHRVNLLDDGFREIGLAQVRGDYVYNGRTYDSSMLTEKFARSGPEIFVTGAVYADSDGDGAYSVGEGEGGAALTVGGAAVSAGGAGGYAHAVPGATGAIEVSHGGVAVRLDLAGRNAKLDFIGADSVAASADLQILSGATSATLLGVADLDLQGSAGAETLTGNAGDNTIAGGGGDDTISGGGGNDTIDGGDGIDTVVLAGPEADWSVSGDRAAAVVTGAAGTLTLTDVEFLRFDDRLADLPVAEPEAPQPLGVADPIGEAGLVTVSQSAPGGWTRVSFATALADPSVVMGPLGPGGAEAATVRVRNVSETGFDVRIDEWGYLDGVHAPLELGWLAVEAGTHTLADSRVVTAGSSFAGDAPVDVTFAGALPSDPVALAQIVTVNEAEPATTRIDGVGALGMELRVQESEGADGVHALEEIDWIAIETGGSAAAGSLALTTGNVVTHAAQQIGFGGAFADTPALLAAMQSLDGIDPSTVRLAGQDASGATVHIEEETSADAETAHTTEEVGLVAMTPGAISGETLAPPPDAIGEARTITLSQSGPDAWTRVTFSQALDDPSVVMGPLSTNGADPASVRVRNVEATGFEVQIDEWDYLDGRHIPETLGFLAVEAGAHTLADGTEIRAGSAMVSHAVSRVSYADTGETPVALAQIVSFNGVQAATTRLRDVSETGFGVAVQEEEGNDGWHAPEEVDWIAITRGTGPGRVVASTGDAVTSDPHAVGFGGAFADTAGAPALLADMQTVHGADTAVVRHTALDTDGATLFVEEERSRDAEMAHTTEVVGVVAWDEGLIFA